jgi:Ca2+-binding EF-hand superfamily protein
MRIVPVVITAFLTLGGMSHCEEPKRKSSMTDQFFERLDANGDGKVTLKEAPEQGKMLVEFLLCQSGKKASGQLNRAEFMRFTHRHTAINPKDKAVAAAIGVGGVKPAPNTCPACAMGLTAEFVFKRLDVNEDKLITVAEFMRSPGMQDMAKAREVVGRLDKNGDQKLSWKELSTAYKARHANCKKPDPATIAANAKRVRPDGRGNENRFAQVFIMRSDKNGDGKIGKDEFRGPSFGFNRLDKNKNGFIETNELGDLHKLRLNDPKTMTQRLNSGDVPKPPRGKRPKGLGGDRKTQSPKKK